MKYPDPNSSRIRQSAWWRECLPAFFFVLIFWSGMLPAHGSPASVPERILLVTSYSPAYEWARQTADGFCSYFREHRSRAVDVDVVELSVFRNLGQQMPMPDYRWIFEKIRNGNYRILVVADLPALEVVKKHLTELPPNLAVVGCGGIHSKSMAALEYPNKSGRLRSQNAWDNVLLGLRQFPETEEIAVIGAAGAEGLDILQRIAARSRELKNVRLQLICGNDTSTSEMLRRVGALPKKSFVVLTHWQSADREDFQPLPNTVKKIVQASPGPVYASNDAYLELGVLGGWLNNGRQLGQDTAALCERILNGTPAAAIPVTVAPASLIFNWPQLVRLGLPPETLREATFINRPDSWSGRFHNGLFLSGGLLGMLLLSLFFLHREHRKKCRNQAIYDAMPLRIVVVDGRGKIHFHQAENHLSPVKIGQVPQQLGERFKDLISEVLADGRERWREFDYDGQRRKAIFSRLPKPVFGVETVMWISMDISELAESRDRLNLHDELLRNTAQLANIEYFHFNVNERKNTIPDNQYWPVRDGVPVEVSEWVAVEDQPQFREAWRKLFKEESTALQISYRAGKPDSQRDFVMYAKRYDLGSAAKASDAQFAGVIQDITELKNRIRDCQDATGLLDSILENFPNWVVIKDIADDFRCVMTNLHMAEQLKRTPLEIVGKTDEEFFPDAHDVETIRRNDLRALGNSGPLQTEESFHDAHGGCRDVVVNRTVVNRSDGTKLLVTVITDVTELKQAQRKAEEYNLVLRTVLDNVHAGVTVKDPDRDFRYLIWNQWLTDKTGLSPEQILDKQDFDLPLLPEVRQAFRDGDLRACEAGSDLVVMEKKERDGRITVNRITRKLLTLPWGKRLLITSVSDLSEERKAAKEREATIAQLNHYVEYERIINHCLQEITRQNDLDESLAFLLREIGETTHADRCYIFEIASDDIHASNTHEWHAPDLKPQRETLQDIDLRDFSGFHNRLLDKKDIAIGDLAQQQPDDLVATVDFWHQHQVRSLLVCGIWENGRLWGYIGIDFVKNVRQLAPSDLHIVHNAGNLVLLAREREQRINALADSVSLQTQVFETISVPIMLLDRQFRVIKTNLQMDQLKSWRSAVACGEQCFQRFCEGKTQPASDCPAQKVLDTGKPCSVERTFGDARMQINAQPIYDRNGKLLYILASGFDITELRRQQEQLASFLNQEQVVSECLKMLVLNRDFDSVLKQILLLLGKQMQMDVCAIFRYDEEMDALVNLQTLSPLEGQEDCSLQKTIPGKAYPNCFQALRAGGLQADLRKAPQTAAERELFPYLKMRGMLAIACVSIHFNNRFWGQVGMEFSSPDKSFGEMEIRLLNATARIIEILLEREALYAKLLNSENEKNMIWELMTVPMVLFDADRHILRVNPATERLCGKSSAEIIAQPCAMTFCQHETPEAECPVALTRQAQTPQHAELTLFGRDFDVFTLPVIENGQLIRVLQIFIDITENNANKRKLLQALEAAEAATRAKSTFLATMSHEIRTPLNAVIGFSELLQGGEIAREEQLEYLRSINFAGNALLQLINDILDLSKLESDQMQIRCEKADLRQLCEEMIAIFSLRAQEKNLALRLVYPEQMPELYICVLRLRQVLLNLIGNAVKFTNQGLITLTVTLKRQPGDVGTLRMEVCDTGIGIDEAAQAHIFQPFFQHEKGRLLQEGTGLGLIISKRLAEHMGGTLSFSSRAGVGSCFVLELMRVRCDDTPSATPHPVASAQQPRRTILLVDDVALNLKVLQAMLKQFNADVLTAASGPEALAVLQRVHPDLILTDMWMPEMNGMELARQIRSNPARNDIAILAVTADAEVSNSFPMEAFDGVLLKPLSLEKLERMFRRLNADGGSYRHETIENR